MTDQDIQNQSERRERNHGGNKRQADRFALKEEVDEIKKIHDRIKKDIARFKTDKETVNHEILDIKNRIKEAEAKGDAGAIKNWEIRLKKAEEMLKVIEQSVPTIEPVPDEKIREELNAYRHARKLQTQAELRVNRGEDKNAIGEYVRAQAEAVAISKKIDDLIIERQEKNLVAVSRVAEEDSIFYTAEQAKKDREEWMSRHNIKKEEEVEQTEIIEEEQKNVETQNEISPVDSEKIITEELVKTPQQEEISVEEMKSTNESVAVDTDFDHTKEMHGALLPTQSPHDEELPLVINETQTEASKFTQSVSLKEISKKRKSNKNIFKLIRDFFTTKKHVSLESSFPSLREEAVPEPITHLVEQNEGAEENPFETKAPLSEINPELSLWDTIEQSIKGSAYEDRFNEITSHELRTFIIDAIKDKATASFSPEEVSDVSIKNKINFDQIFSDNIFMDEIFESAQGLTSDEIANIRNHYITKTSQNIEHDMNTQNETSNENSLNSNIQEFGSSLLTDFEPLAEEPQVVPEERMEENIQIENPSVEEPAMPETIAPVVEDVSTLETPVQEENIQPEQIDVQNQEVDKTISNNEASDVQVSNEVMPSEIFSNPQVEAYAHEVTDKNLNIYFGTKKLFGLTSTDWTKSKDIIGTPDHPEWGLGNKTVAEIKNLNVANEIAIPDGAVGINNPRAIAKMKELLAATIENTKISPEDNDNVIAYMYQATAINIDKYIKKG